MTEINQKFPKWTTDKLFVTLSLKPSWRYYEFEQEFGLSVNDLMDFCDLFCIYDHQIHVYSDATKSDLEHFANFLNQQETTSQTKIEIDSFSSWFTVFLEEKDFSVNVPLGDFLKARHFFSEFAYQSGVLVSKDTEFALITGRHQDQEKAPLNIF